MYKLKLFKAEARIENINSTGYIFYPLGYFSKEEDAKQVAEEGSAKNKKNEAKVTTGFLKVFYNYEDYLSYQKYAKTKQLYDALSAEEKDLFSLDDKDLENIKPRMVTNHKFLKGKTVYRPVWKEFNPLSRCYEEKTQASYFVYPGTAKKVAYEKAKETNGRYVGYEEFDVKVFDSVKEYNKHKKQESNKIRGLQ